MTRVPFPHRRLPLATALALAASAAAAQTEPITTAAVRLDTVTVQGNYDNAVGTSDAASQGSVTAKLIQSRPTLRPAEVLEFVPGVIVTQHSGDGKANQYFLRGFNLDHGTDFASFVDGMPVNMPTHAHGQGYSDLNWLIPEEGAVLRRRGRLLVGRGRAHRAVRHAAEGHRIADARRASVRAHADHQIAAGR
jgi:outer membrane receptor for ferrienterochelin and colicin